MAGSEFVESNSLCRYSKICKHAGTRLDHHRRPTEIEFDRVGLGVGFEMLLQNDLVNEPSVAIPSILWKW